MRKTGRIKKFSDGRKNLTVYTEKLIGSSVEQWFALQYFMQKQRLEMIRPG